jgi:flagellin-like protein
MKNERNHGVSTIIATILMVAVTVVLAGVLYVMTIGFGGGGNDNLPPLGSWLDVSPVNNTSAKLKFGQFTKDVSTIDIQVLIYESGNSNFTRIKIASPLTDQTTDCIIEGHNSTTITATYTDYNFQGSNVNAGDFLTISNLISGQYYTIEVYHAPTQSVISMTGDSSSFQLQ